jgi:transcriptional regulator with XRE-family HTH domain
MSSHTESFGALLRGHRVAAGLTQEALAARAGLSSRGIADLERGVRRAPYRHTVTQLRAPGPGMR